MAFSLGEDAHAMNEINLVPLIDIMLVLMIIFLVTATVLNPTVPLNLPKTGASISQIPDAVIQISINADGELFWDDEQLDMDVLIARLNAQDGDTTIFLRADKNSTYEPLAKILAQAGKAGLHKIAFVHE